MTDVETVSVDLIAHLHSRDEDDSGQQEVAFLKIDVEGVELSALRSALTLFAERRVQQALIEFGPSNNWRRSEANNVQGSTAKDAVDVLARIRSFGYAVSVEDANTKGPLDLNHMPPNNATRSVACDHSQLQALVAIGASRQCNLFLDRDDHQICPTFISP